MTAESTTSATIPTHTALNERPSRLSMEGYIYNADQVLQVALHPESKRIPEHLLQKCLGICLLTVTHVGAAIFSAHYGTGVMVVKQQNNNNNNNKDDNGAISWSLPAAIMTAGYGMGLVAGGKQDQIVTFLMNQETLDDFINKPQSRMGLNGALSLGKKGGVANLGMEAEGKGSVSMVYTNGVYVGASIMIGTMAHAKGQNEVFYGEETKVKAIVNNHDGHPATPPDDMKEQLEHLHKKLTMLVRGQTWTPTAEDLDRSLKHKLHAQESSRNFDKDDISASRHKRISLPAEATTGTSS